MAHFAEIDTNNIVSRVIVVDDKDCLDESGNESEIVGSAFCTGLFGGTWKQTSYNGSIRKNFAGIGHKYDPILDAFIPPHPFPSWILNEETCNWESPIPYPEDNENIYAWNEFAQQWEIISVGE